MRAVLIGIEAGRRLVVENHLGLERERAREADALLHAAGEIARAHRLDAGQPDELERLRDARADLVFTHRAPELLAQPVCDVLADVERVEQRRALKEIGDAAPHLDEVALVHLRDFDVRRT